MLFTIGSAAHVREEFRISVDDEGSTRHHVMLSQCTLPARATCVPAGEEATPVSTNLTPREPDQRLIQRVPPIFVSKFIGL
jgi:hypothetical protein